MGLLTSCTPTQWKWQVGQHTGESHELTYRRPAPDFTPVCTTKMGHTAQLLAEYAKRNI